MMLHNKKGNYNTKTTICISRLNPMCNEKEIVEELNIVLRDERNKNIDATVPEKPRNFILSSIVFFDTDKKRSKQFAFVDFNTEDAANICVKQWNNASMKKYPNRLQVTQYEKEHVKLTKDERDRSR